MKKIIYSLLLILSNVAQLASQELQVEVQINTPALKIADPAIFRTLETAIREFYNNTKWTNDQFEPEEKIEASVQINVKDDISANTFLVDIFINSGRPIYNSNYNSPILNHIDRDVRFFYEQQNPIVNNAQAHTDNLSSILSYYAYIILGFDYDTFSPLGGDQYFKVANAIIANIPPNVSSGDKSWTAESNNRNRYWLIENLLDPRLKPYRMSQYEYHLNGLDRMYSDISVSKAVILGALKEMNEAHNAYRNSMVIQMFSNAKRGEILDIFKNSVKNEQRQVYRIMSLIDPGQVQLLQELN